MDEDGIILKGHGRRLAAMTAGFKSFPVVVHDKLSETDKKALRIADNQVAVLAGWDTLTAAVMAANSTTATSVRMEEPPVSCQAR